MFMKRDGERCSLGFAACLLTAISIFTACFITNCDDGCDWVARVFSGVNNYNFVDVDISLLSLQAEEGVSIADIL